MQMIRTKHVVILVLVVLIATLSPFGVAQSEESKCTSGGTEQGKWLFGFRAGFAPLTQSLTDGGTSTDVGSLVNLEGMYSLNKWVLVGLMLEWERHAVDLEPNIDFGHQDTVSLLPTVQVRPGRFGPLTPYASMGFGVNVNSFSDDIPGINTSPSNNFAWRLAWG